MKKIKINWKKRYFNILNKYQKSEKERHKLIRAENNRQWEIETGRR